MDNRELAIKIFQQLNRNQLKQGGSELGSFSINVIMDVLDQYNAKAHVELIDIGDGLKAHPAILAAILPDDD